MHRRKDQLVILQTIQGGREVFQPKNTYSLTKAENFSKQKHTGLRLIITNRLSVIDTENKHVLMDK